jgi:hypothetical protein
MQSKILLGVGHQSDLELVLVKEKVISYRPSSVGIELPQDIIERHAHGLSVYFFSDLAHLSKERGSSFIPLEDGLLYDMSQSLAIARNLLIDRRSMDSLKHYITELQEEIDPYKSPEQTYAPKKLLKIHTDALRLLAEHENVVRLQTAFSLLNIEREKVMLEQILATNPEMVIIGDGHARELANRLSDYVYIRQSNGSKY